MRKLRKNGVPRWMLVFGASCLAAASWAANLPASLPEKPLGPDAKAFDALYKRLETGDLTALGTQQQQKIVEQLQILLPAGDARRQRLLDSQHCSLDYENNKEGFAFADAKLAEALGAGDAAAAVRFYFCRAYFQTYLTEPKDGLADYERGIELARSIDDDSLVALGLLPSSENHSYLGIHGKALAELQEAQSILQRHESKELLAQTLARIGVAYRRLGYFDKARECLTQSIDQAQHFGDQELAQRSLVQLGMVDEEDGRASAALTTLLRALELAPEVVDRATTNLVMATVLNDLKRYAEALETLRSAEADYASIGASFAGQIAYERGRAHAGLGQTKIAIEMFDKAETELKGSNNLRYQEKLYEAKAKVLVDSGHSDLALAEYQRYLDAHDKLQRERANQQTELANAELEDARKQLQSVRQHAEKTAEKQKRQLGQQRRGQWIALAGLALLIGLLATHMLLRRRAKKNLLLDQLTGIGNRRSVERFAAAAMRQARSTREPLAILLLDVDRSKTINHAHGHAVGDEVIRRIARLCRDAIGERDQVGRFAGEEFLIVRANSTLEQASDTGEWLRDRVEALDLDDLVPGLKVTASIGVAELADSDQRLADFERRADEALHFAKAHGRNRVVAAPRKDSASAPSPLRDQTIISPQQEPDG
jgi:diguanylate cyclase (GGDEF)-like protein